MDNKNQILVSSNNFSILLIGNDTQLINQLKELISEFFQSVIVSSNREDALKKFRENRFDIIVVSENLPECSGAEFTSEIRKKDKEIPILLITDFENKISLVDSVDAGVTQFIKKDTLFESTLNALKVAIKIVTAENLELIRLEKDNLKIKDKELSIQQKLAFKKQQYVIRDDFYYKKLDLKKENRTETWFINLRYIPYHLLSGDFYSIRRLSQDQVLLYLSDAMGKGLSAFLTSSIVTSFLNYIVDRAIEEDSFDFDRFLSKFIEYSKKHLTEEEALCVLFVLLDLRKEKLHVVNFSMPPVLVEVSQNTITCINSKNLPIMIFTSQYKKETLDISETRKILLCSDGLFHPSYIENIERDFLDAPFRFDLYGKFKDKVKDIDDDITFIFIKKFDNPFMWKQEYFIDGTLSEIKRISAEIEISLSLKGYDPIFIVEIINAMSEILMNAYEHGCLGIGGKKKNILIRQGSYEEYLLKIEKSLSKKIRVEIGEFTDRESSFLMLIVEDQGEGFDTSIIKETMRNIELLHSRGIAMVKGLVDEIYYNERGNQVTLIKRIKKD